MMENKLDIGIIANSTSPSNREELIAELGEPENGFFGPLKATYRGLTIEIIPLDMQPNDPTTVEGNRKGKIALAGAVEYLHQRGAEIIDFAASTKRLPGKNGQEMKAKYPNTIFTIGDNATAISLLSVIEDSFDKIGFERNADKAACMGDGFMGREAINYMLARKAKNIQIISRHCNNNLPDSVRRIEKVSEIDSGTGLFFSCAHNHTIEPKVFASLLHPKAVIIDVAAPWGIIPEVYAQLPSGVKLLHAGSFFLKDIDFDFPPRILSFPLVGFWYGCFTEAVMLMLAKRAGEDLKNFNFFEINPESQELINKYLVREGAFVPLINFYAPEKGITYALLRQNI